MTADMTRQEVKFIRWDIPSKKQEDLQESVRNGTRARMDAARCTFTALGETATALWKNGGCAFEYVQTMKDGTDGDLVGGTVPNVRGTDACYNRDWLISILSNMTSDYVKLRIDDRSLLMVMMGEVGEKKAAAILAPRIEREDEE